MLEDWYVKNFDDSIVKLEPMIKKAISMFAEKNSFTITEATNYLVATKINVLEWFHNTVIKEADKAYDEEIAEYKNQTAQ